MASERPQRGCGLSFFLDDSMNGLNLSVKRGALVQSVAQGAPAQKAGIKGGSIPARVAGQDITIGGDIIVRVDDKPITSAEDLTSYIQGKHAGQTVKVVVVRSGKKQTFSVQLTKRPQTSTQQSATTTP